MKELLFTSFGIIISLLSFLLTYVTFKSKSKKKTKEEGKNEGILISKIDYIKKGIENLEILFKSLEKTNHDLDIRITKLEEKIRKENAK